jgi:hypothetical protein
MRRHRDTYVNLIEEATASADSGAIVLRARGRHGWYRMRMPVAEAERLATDLAIALHACHQPA